MAAPVYLNYKNSDFKDAQFEFDTTVPFLWQELYDESLMEQQKDRILKGFAQNNPTDAQLRIPIAIGIQNLEKRTQNLTQESERKKKLRFEFLAFLQNQVAADTNLEIDLFGLTDLYAEPQTIYADLLEFQTSHKKRLKYQREKLSYRSIGYNPDFEAFSPTYQFMKEENQIFEQINDERHQAWLEKHKKPDSTKQTTDQLFLLAAGVILAISGVLLLLLKQNFKYGFGLLIIGLGLLYFWNRYRINS